MTRRYLLVLSLCAGCATTPPSTQEQPLRAYPFIATGHKLDGTLKESLRGTAFVSDDRIRIVVVAGGVGQLAASRTKRPIGWSAGLSYCHTEGASAGQWDFRRQTKVTSVRRIRARGDTLTDALEFVLTRVRGLDLSAHWLTIQQHQHILPPGDSLWYEATRPVHSQAFVFDADSVRQASTGVSRCNEDH